MGLALAIGELDKVIAQQRASAQPIYLLSEPTPARRESN
jgi:hypothetical protein